jgi:nucleoside-diphosphate-sugar epimerase
VSFREFVAAAARAAGTRVTLLPLPGRLLSDLARVWERIALPPRIRREQILRLLEDKDFDTAAARRDFGWDPATVEEGLAREAASLGGEAGP